MNARDILENLRKGDALSPEQAGWFGGALGQGRISDAQAGAFAMGICRAPMSEAARTALTLAMAQSGVTLQWDLPGPVVDKHSTGGVGDCVSLVLAPALAACGAYVPMISGRGLGHTGGTLDKLESIPGYRAEVSLDRLRRVTETVGCAIVGASADIAPADKRLYAVRDVTGTVESIDLITASILSKKLAAGLDALVLDVKTGNGAFMKTYDDADALANALVSTANGAGCPTVALISDMSQPLIASAGNALEVSEVMETLTGTGVNDSLWRLTAQLGGAALFASGMVLSPQQGTEEINQVLRSGGAAEKFGEMIAALGGPVDFIDRWRDRLPGAPVMREVFAPSAGFVAQVDARALGRVVVQLGGGRMRDGDKINPAVGLSHMASIGEEINQTRPLAVIHAANRNDANVAEASVIKAFRIGPLAKELPQLIHGSIGI